MKKAIIIINAYSQLPSELNQPYRIKEELELLGVQVDLMRNGQFSAFINESGLFENRLHGYDFCVYLDKDKYLSQLLEGCGLRLFNRHEAIACCDDKMQTYLALSQKGFAMPKTLAGFLCYTPNAPYPESAIDRIEKELAYPVVVKECYGSLGKGVHKADNREELVQLAKKLQYVPHLYQQFIATSVGRDVRVIVVGGKAVAMMQRVSDTDFRSNVELGGRAEPFYDEEAKRVAERVAVALNLDYCGIDLLTGENGYCVCEVNSNAFFGGIERVTGVNVAKLYAKYIYQSVYGE